VVLRALFLLLEPTRRIRHAAPSCDGEVANGTLRSS
jgi:hypothetical protein